MTLHQEWTDKLSDYLDDELTADERTAVDAHLRECRECVAVLNDLKRVVARAQNLPTIEPLRDLWPGIADAGTDLRSRSWKRSVPGAQPKTIAFTVSQLAAAAALVAAVSGGIVWQFAISNRSAEALRHTEHAVASATAQPQPEAAQDFSLAVGAKVERVSLADAQYEAAVSDLEKALQKGRGKLDASTIAIVEHNLETIDQAIRQAREALAADPANSYLSGHLVEARRRKLELLRRATELAETN